MRRTASFVVLILLTLGLMWAGYRAFVPVRDGDLRPNLTYSDLYRMGSDIAFFYEQTDPEEATFVRDVHTLKELWSKLEASKVLSKHVILNPIPEDYMIDAWGRPYQLQVRARDRETVIRVISCGANGIFENGQGDDLYVEITADGKKVEIIRHPDPLMEKMVSGTSYGLLVNRCFKTVKGF